LVLPPIAPGGVAALHVAGIEAGVAPRHGGAAADVEAVDAEHDLHRAISSTCFRPLTTGARAVLKSSASTCALIAFKRRGVPP
jgi:hypothetical protein